MKFSLDPIYEKIGKRYGQENDAIRLANIIVFTMGFGSTFLFILGVVAQLKGNKILAYADYSAFCFLIILLIFFYVSRQVRTTILLGVSFTACFYFFLLVYGGINNTAFVWYYTFPLYACFCLGSKKGFLFSFYLGVMAIVYFVIDDHFPVAAQYSYDFKLRFLASYLVVSFFAFVAERLREREQQKLQGILKVLKRKVRERTLQLTEKNEELKITATTDYLTGIYNRSKLDEVLNYEINQAKRYQGKLSLIMIDIDHFKRVNDEFGHLRGDEVLVVFAELIKDSMRSVDSFGRWGGEEFMLICPSTGNSNAFAVAEKIRLKIQEHIFAEVGHLTASFGVSTYCDGDSKIKLIKQTDNALYRAKENRNMSVLHQPTS